MRGSVTSGKGWGLVILGGLLALAGCVTPPGRPAPRGPGPAAAEVDPLVGGVPIPRSNAPGAVARSGDDLKPGLVPDTGGPTSPAALTRGAVGAPTPDRRPPSAPALGGPRPRAGAVEGPGDILQTSATERPAGELTYEQLQEQLRARGVEWQRLKNDNLRPDLWTFDCAIPDRANRDLRRVFEGEGASPQAAMRAAIEQIDRERP